MLRRLEIENYGLIESAQMLFADGATMFTGETGSGKTMLLGALGFALGARAESDSVRRGAERASVTLGFDPDPALFARLCADGFELEPGEEATFAREIAASGKSSVRVNGRPATAGYVREIGTLVAQRIGQHESQRLLSAAYHLDAVDRYAGARGLQARELVATVFARTRDAQAALAALLRDDRRARERYDEARAALAEIEALAPSADEDERLEERRGYLDHAERIATALRGAHAALSDDDTSASVTLGAASAMLGSIAEIGPRLGEMSARAHALQADAAELSADIVREADATERDPAELERINARLDALDRLKRRYGRTLDAVEAHARTSREIVATFELRDRDVGSAREEVAQAQATLEREAAELTALRIEAASRLQAAIMLELGDLALAGARIEMQILARSSIGAEGAESIELVFAANPGEPLRALSKVASGGELSRVLLALVVVLAGARENSALVFDEIDAGIGGVTATAVGMRIGRLARSAQVLCVTHLAQLAAWADRHYILEKRDDADGVTIALREAEGESARASELARMLSGASNAIAHKHGLALLREARATVSGGP